jgi:hypothetical protein
MNLISDSSNNYGWVSRSLEYYNLYFVITLYIDWKDPPLDLFGGSELSFCTRIHFVFSINLLPAIKLLTTPKPKSPVLSLNLIKIISVSILRGEIKYRENVITGQNIVYRNHHRVFGAVISSFVAEVNRVEKPIIRLATYRFTHTMVSI